MEEEGTSILRESTRAGNGRAAGGGSGASGGGGRKGGLARRALAVCLPSFCVSHRHRAPTDTMEELSGPPSPPSSQPSPSLDALALLAILRLTAPDDSVLLAARRQARSALRARRSASLVSAPAPAAAARRRLSSPRNPRYSTMRSCSKDLRDLADSVLEDRFKARWGITQVVEPPPAAPAFVAVRAAAFVACHAVQGKDSLAALAVRHNTDVPTL